MSEGIKTGSTIDQGPRDANQDEYEDIVNEVFDPLVGPGGSQDEIDPSPDGQQEGSEDLSNAVLIEQVVNIDGQVRPRPEAFEYTPTIETLELWQDKQADLWGRLASGSIDDGKTKQGAVNALNKVEIYLDPAHWLIRNGRESVNDKGETYVTQDLESMFLRVAAVAKTKNNETARRGLAVQTLKDRQNVDQPTEPSDSDVAAEIAIIKRQYGQIKSGLGQRPEGAPDWFLGFDTVRDMHANHGMFDNLKFRMSKGEKKTYEHNGDKVALDSAIENIEARVALSRRLREEDDLYFRNHDSRLEAAKRKTSNSNNQQNRGSRDQAKEEQRQQNDAEDDAETENEEDNQPTNSDDDQNPLQRTTLPTYLRFLDDMRMNEGNEYDRAQRIDALKQSDKAFDSLKTEAVERIRQHEDRRFAEDATRDEIDDLNEDRQHALNDVRSLLLARGELAYHLSQGDLATLDDYLNLRTSLEEEAKKPRPAETEDESDAESRPESDSSSEK